MPNSTLERWNAFVEEVRALTTLRDIVEQDVKLDRSNFGLCPFHNENTASFHLFGDNDEAYKCFGCNASGDVFDYVARRNQTDFRGSVEILAERVGKAWTPSGDDDPEEVKKELNRIRNRRDVEKALTDAALLCHSGMPKEARDWIKKQYGFDDATINEAMIGWADETLYQFLRATYSREELLATGLFYKPKEEGSGKPLRCHFHNRVVFPYFRGGRVVYAIARAVPEHTPPIFKNGKEHPAPKYLKLQTYDENKRPHVSEFIDNDVFYGEDDALRKNDSITIIEGVTDRITIHSLGIPSISPVTTRVKKAERERLVKLITKADRVYVLGDNDEGKHSDGKNPGLDGARDTARDLFAAGRDVRLPILPPGMDATEFVQAKKAEAPEDVDPTEYAKDQLLALYETAPTFIDVEIEAIPKELNPRELTRRLNPVLSMVLGCEPMEKDIYAKSIAKRFGLRKADVEKAIYQSVQGDQDDKRHVKGAVLLHPESGRFLDVATSNYITDFAISPRRAVSLQGMTGAFVLECDVQLKSGEMLTGIRLDNETLTSKRAFVGRRRHPGMVFTGDDDNLQTITLNLWSNADKHIQGVTEIGLHETEEEPLWVTEDVTFSSTERKEDPKLIAIGDHELSQRIAYDFPKPEEAKALAKSALPDLINLNEQAVTIPILSWLFASILHPRFKGEFGSFPVLFVYGSAGCGKTSMLKRAMMPLLGFKDVDPFGADATSFVMLKRCGSTNALPVWVDEFKGDMGSKKVDALTRLLRDIYGGKAEARGTKDQSLRTYDLSSSILVSGETRPEETAVLERIISVNPRKDSLTPERREIFERLVHQKLRLLAVPIIQYVMGQDFKAVADEAGKLVDALIDRVGVMPARVDQNMRTLAHGLLLLDGFAQENEVELPEFNLESVFKNIIIDVSEFGSRAKDSLDVFLESCSVMAATGTITAGVHFKWIEGEGRLALYTQACYDAYCQHMRSMGRGDSTDGIRMLKKKAMEPREYIENGNELVEFGERKNRCIILNTKLLPDSLEVSFNKSKNTTLSAGQTGWGTYQSPGEDLN